MRVSLHEETGIVHVCGERTVNDQRISRTAVVSLLTVNPQVLEDEQSIARLL